MKAKNLRHTRRSRREEAPLPHELGPHLFAMIRRRLLAQRQPAPPPATQLTFAFE
jgi:hypothetical protein